MERQWILRGFITGCLLITLVIGGFGGGSIWAEGNFNPGVELTVYNDNLALVKDCRLMDIPAGSGQLKFSDVASAIDPTSVKFRSVTTPGVKVLEQNYEYDVINDSKLLEKYLGQKIRLTTVKGDSYEGFLLTSGDNLILGSQPGGGEVKVIKAAQIQTVIFPEMPNGLVVRPTLTWLVNNPGKVGSQQVEVTYLTGAISWKADYVATLNATDDKLDLTGWVTLDNKSGGDYRDARLKLVAGDIHRAPEEKRQQVIEYLTKAAAAPQADNFQEQSFFEYHLYTLNRPTTLSNNQLKQVELLSSSAIPAKKLFIYEGAVDPKNVNVMMEFKNSKENNLGIPLPKGIIRVQKADSEGSLQFIGEDRIDHTPQDEKVRINLGNAFDIVGERVKTNVKDTSVNTREESYQITLHNHKKETATVTVVEDLNPWNEWQITKSDHSFVKTSAGKIEYTVPLAANGQEIINYTVRYKW